MGPQKRIVAILVFIISSIVIFSGKGFLTPQTFYLGGDIYFPLDPARLAKDYYFSWYDVSGAGVPNLVPSFLSITLVGYLLWLIQIPLWIINRIWVIAPLFFLAYCTYYLYYSLFDEEKGTTGGILAGVFSIFVPYLLYYYNPFLIYSLAGFSLFIGSLIRGMKYPTKHLHYAFFVGIAVWLLSFSPRTLYITCLVSLIYVLFHFVFLETQIVKSIKFILTSFVLSIFINFFWILPIFVSLLNAKFNTHGMLGEVYGSDTGMFTARVNLLLSPAGSKAIQWVSRLILDYDSPTSYFRIPLVAFFSFLLPLFVYLPLVLVKKRSVYPIACVTFILTCFATTLRYPLFSQIYSYLYAHLPGFMMLNLLFYWFSALGIFYAILFGISIQLLLHKIKSHGGKTIFAGLSFVFVVFLIGEPVSLGVIPVKNECGTIVYPSHASSIPVPHEYFQLHMFLSSHKDSSARILNLPLTSDYVAYTWWHSYCMCEVLNLLSPLGVFGANSSFRFSKLGNILTNPVDPNFSATVLEECQYSNIRFILLHKDYYNTLGLEFYPFIPYRTYFNSLVNLGFADLSMDNAYFSLYELKATKGRVFYRKEASDSDIPIREKSAMRPSTNRILSVPRFDGGSYMMIPSTMFNTSMFCKSSSLFAWIYPESINSPQGIAAQWMSNENTQHSYALVLSNDGHLVLRIDGNDVISSLNTVKEKEWSSIGFVYSNDLHQFTTYLNGMPSYPVKSKMKSLSAPALPLLIGADASLSPRYFKGYIHNVQLYGIALDVGTAAGLYREGLNNHPLLNKGVIGVWLSDTDIMGKVVSDFSGNHNSGYCKGIRQWETIENPHPLSSFAVMQEPVHNFVKCSPVSYRLHLVSEKPFYLVFTEHFHRLWECSVNGKTIKAHSATALRENQWYIEDKGKLDIKIEFTLQKLFSVGLLISIISILSVVIVLCRQKWIR